MLLTKFRMLRGLEKGRMTQSLIPLIEVNLTCSLKPGKVEFFRKQKAERLGRMQSWWRAGWQRKGCGWRVGDRSRAKHQSSCQWSKQLPALNSSELHCGFSKTGHEVVELSFLSLLLSKHPFTWTPRLCLSSLNLKVTNSTWFALTLLNKFPFIQWFDWR